MNIIRYLELPSIYFQMHFVISSKNTKKGMSRNIGTPPSRVNCTLLDSNGSLRRFWFSSMTVFFHFYNQSTVHLVVFFGFLSFWSAHDVQLKPSVLAMVTHFPVNDDTCHVMMPVMIPVIRSKPPIPDATMG